MHAALIKGVGHNILICLYTNFIYLFIYLFVFILYVLFVICLCTLFYLYMYLLVYSLIHSYTHAFVLFCLFIFFSYGPWARGRGGLVLKKPIANGPFMLLHREIAAKFVIRCITQGMLSKKSKVFRLECTNGQKSFFILFVAFRSPKL